MRNVPLLMAALAFLLPAPSARGQIHARLLKDLVPGTGSGSPHLFTTLPTTTIFLTRNSEIWRTDGTTAGTKRLKQIQLRPNVVAPGFSIVLGNKAFLLLDSYDGKGPSVIWETDGTVAGTKETVVMPQLGWARRPVVAGKKLFFDGLSAGTVGSNLWCIEPQAANPKPVHLRPFKPKFRFGVTMQAIGDEVLFSVDDAKLGSELWRSDGTAVGTKLLKDLYPGARSGFFHMAPVFGDRLYFTGNDSVRGWELWETDGTTPGTKLAKEFDPNGDGWPTILGVAGELVYCSRNNRGTYELWAVHRKTFRSEKVWTGNGAPRGAQPFRGGLLFLGWSAPHFTDGTKRGTVQLTAQRLVGFRRVFVPLGDRLAFFHEFGKIWVTDGTVAGTRAVTTRPAGTRLSLPFESHGKLFFSGTATATGNEPYVADWPLAHATTTAGRGLGVGTRVPSLRASDPILGTGLLATLDGARKGSVAMLALSVGTSPAFEIASGAWVHLNPATLIPLVGAPPGLLWKVALPLPNDTRLAGERLTLQALLLGTGAKRGFELSNAVYARMGS